MRCYTDAMKLLIRFSLSFVFIFCALTLPLSAADSKKPEQKKPTKPAPAVRFSNPSTMAQPVSAYSQVVEVTGGKLVFIAGQIAIDPAGNLVGKDDFRAQVEQVFKNIKLAVESAGGNMNNLVKTNYYIAEAVEPTQFPAMRDVRDRYINTAAPPASTLVVVKRLARPEYLIEIEAVAVIND